MLSTSLLGLSAAPFLRHGGSMQLVADLGRLGSAAALLDPQEAENRIDSYANGSTLLTPMARDRLRQACAEAARGHREQAIAMLHDLSASIVAESEARQRWAGPTLVITASCLALIAVSILMMLWRAEAGMLSVILRRLFDATDRGMVVLKRRDLTFSSVNERFGRLVGCSSRTLLGSSISVLRDGSLTDSEAGQLEATLSSTSNEIVLTNVKLRRRDHSVIRTTWHIVPLGTTLVCTVQDCECEAARQDERIRQERLDQIRDMASALKDDVFTAVCLLMANVSTAVTELPKLRALVKPAFSSSVTERRLALAENNKVAVITTFEDLEATLADALEAVEEVSSKAIDGMLHLIKEPSRFEARSERHRPALGAIHALRNDQEGHTE